MKSGVVIAGWVSVYLYDAELQLPQRRTEVGIKLGH